MKTRDKTSEKREREENDEEDIGEGSDIICVDSIGKAKELPLRPASESQNHHRLLLIYIYSAYCSIHEFQFTESWYLIYVNLIHSRLRVRQSRLRFRGGSSRGSWSLEELCEEFIWLVVLLRAGCCAGERGERRGAGFKLLRNQEKRVSEQRVT
ncbi:uncharacterized protein A4U43_C05F24260 [Asparagus officinalis]|uniref:Uncharacterized protein n=1 Tax=Asparagus officinalis TaxID=4686 RepID=A0A5P1EZH5_ASPOF|nr:uncharacterized protein A4U43_C05F24260 [Asparagus officinalis]